MATKAAPIKTSCIGRAPGQRNLKQRRRTRPRASRRSRNQGQLKQRIRKPLVFRTKSTARATWPFIVQLGDNSIGRKWGMEIAPLWNPSVRGRGGRLLWSGRGGGQAMDMALAPTELPASRRAATLFFRMPRLAGGDHCGNQREGHETQCAQEFQYHTLPPWNEHSQSSKRRIWPGQQCEGISAVLDSETLYEVLRALEIPPLWRWTLLSR